MYTDAAERKRRMDKLCRLAVDERGQGGWGIPPERFQAALHACRDAWKADPVGFIEQNVAAEPYVNTPPTRAPTPPHPAKLWRGRAHLS